MLAADVADADIVYCFATCFSPEIVGAMEAKLAAEMKPGARLVLVSKQMETDGSSRSARTGGTSLSSRRTASGTSTATFTVRRRARTANDELLRVILYTIDTTL